MHSPRSTPSSKLGASNDKAVECLIKDRDALLAFTTSRLGTGSICEHRQHPGLLSANVQKRRSRSISE